MSRREYYRDWHPDCGGNSSKVGVIYFAIRIAQKFRDKVPTPEQLRDAFGMSRATSFRWVAAIKAARGL